MSARRSVHYKYPLPPPPPPSFSTFPLCISSQVHLVQTFKALEWNKIVERSQTLGRAQRDRTTRLNTLSKTSVIYEWKEEHQDTKRGRMRERKVGLGCGVEG